MFLRSVDMNSSIACSAMCSGTSRKNLRHLHISININTQPIRPSITVPRKSSICSGTSRKTLRHLHTKATKFKAVSHSPAAAVNPKPIRSRHRAMSNNSRTISPLVSSPEGERLHAAVSDKLGGFAACPAVRLRERIAEEPIQDETKRDVKPPTLAVGG